jgi:protein-L-isoaspartate(D-aspartate) O-methyltransferase
MAVTPQDALAERRRFYAEELAAVGGIRSKILLQAFALVRREDFLPPGPWIVEAIDGSYYPTEDAAVSRILHAVGVCLDLPRTLNSGNPARIGRQLEAAAVCPGETVFHVGAGLGYFTAILAQLVEGHGRVIAAEIDPALRAQARNNLRDSKNVTIIEDALAAEMPTVDVIFSSAGMADIPLPWIAALAPGGRMLLPLIGAFNAGYVFLFQKNAAGEPLRVRRIAYMRYYPCVGKRDIAEMHALDAAMVKRQLDLLQDLTLTLDPHTADDTCWMHGAAYCLRLDP